MEQIGTVEILKPRLYPLDPMARDRGTEVVVAPGAYPLYRDGISHFWMMQGRINTGRMYRLGDGIYSMAPWDQDDGPEVTFPSRVFGPDEWAEFKAEPTCTEGNPEQRVRVQEENLAPEGKQ